MLYANNDGQKILATPGAQGTCPSCNAPAVPKCGTIKVWHWAHEYLDQCDTWSEGETDWHLMWKTSFPQGNVEVPIIHDMQRHIADVLINNTVIECQHSPISVEEIREREEFYGKMMWLFDMTDNDHIELTTKSAHVTFRWKHPKKTLWSIKKPLYLDLGHGILRVKKIHEDLPCRGWGFFLTYDEFKRFVGNVTRFS